MFLQQIFTGRKSNYQPYSRSFFLSSTTIPTLRNNSPCPWPFDCPISNLDKIFIPFELRHLNASRDKFPVSLTASNSLVDDWAAIVIDVGGCGKNNCPCYFVNGKIGVESWEAGRVESTKSGNTAILDELSALLLQWFQSNNIQLPKPLKMKHFHESGLALFDDLKTDSDSGIFIVASLPFISYGCPITFTDDTIEQHRLNAAYYALSATTGNLEVTK